LVATVPEEQKLDPKMLIISYGAIVGFVPVGTSINDDALVIAWMSGPTPTWS
jgi:hypothetical protein